MKKGKIKFRAWDGEKMYYPIVFEFGVNNLNGRTSIAFEHNGGMLTTSYIMQYIGLKDKNGVEIYEGDIVAKFDFKDPYFRSVVVYRLGAFGYVSEGDFIAFGSNYYFMWVNGKSDKIVIIGNIYETPELLVMDNKEEEQTAKQKRGYKMKKPFKTRVLTLLRKEGWEIENVTDSPIVDFIMSRDKRFKRACVIKPHGHLLKAEVQTLVDYGRAHKMYVLCVHESDDHEIRFVRLYPRLGR